MSGIHQVKFPFVRETYSGPLNGEFVDDATVWRPGTRRVPGEYDGGYGYEDETYEADGEGFMVLEVLGAYKPGKYPERTFYLRRFIDPDGKEFGKAKVRVIATTAFKHMAKGYRYTYALPNKKEFL